MKKLVSILLAAVLVLTFAACARQAENVGETTTAASGEGTTLSAEEAQQALIEVGSDKADDKSGVDIAHGTQEGNIYENDTLGIKITPPSSYEALGEEEAANPNNDYFVIELTENHDSVEYKTVTISITENVAYKEAEDYIASSNGFISSETLLKSVGTVNIGGREYTCAKWDYVDAENIDEANSVDYILVENGTLVILGFDQMTDDEITDFFKNYIEQY